MYCSDSTSWWFNVTELSEVVVRIAVLEMTWPRGLVLCSVASSNQAKLPNETGITSFDTFTTLKFDDSEDRTRNT